MIIYVPQDVVDRLNDRLKTMPEKMPDALRRTINSVAKHTRKQIPERVRMRYTIEDAREKIKKTSELESARGKQFQATITIKGHPEPLMNFEVTKNEGKVSAKAKVLQTSEMKDLTLLDKGKTLKAFVQTMTNKDKQGNITHHVGVFRRMTEKEQKESTSKMKSPIKQLYSTSIPQMVKNDETYRQIEKDIKEELRKTLDGHIKSVMEGMK